MVEDLQRRRAMVREKGKAGDKGKGRPKKLSVKKQPIKDLDVPKGKDAKGGVAMTEGKSTPKLMKK